MVFRTDAHSRNCWLGNTHPGSLMSDSAIHSEVCTVHGIRVPEDSVPESVPVSPEWQDHAHIGECIDAFPE